MSGSAARSELGERTLKRLEQVQDIPTLPPVLVRVWDLTSAGSGASAKELAAALELDPGLTGAVLRLANSAYLGFPGKVVTVTQAVIVLGFDTVRNLATGASVFRALSSSAEGMDTDGFFRHSLATAVGARVIMSDRVPHRAGTVFCAGILHDLGKLVLAEFLPAEWNGIQQRMESGTLQATAEQQALGISHEEVGEWFAHRWRLPAKLRTAIRWHHAPGNVTEHEDCVAAVHVGDVIAHRIGAGGSGRRDVPEPDAEALRLLSLDAAGLDDLAPVVEEALSGTTVTLTSGPGGT